jgi:putative membrane protein
MTRWIHMLLAVCVALSIACAPDEAPERTDVVGPPPRDDIGFEATTADPTEANGTDREFVEAMKRHTRMKVELGQLAQKRAQTDSVREFAATMVREHQQMDAELQKLAAETDRDAARPDDHADDVQAARSRLEQLTGGEFDREYMRLMVEEHEHAVRRVENRAARAEHEPVRQWAERRLPTLRSHLERARDIHLGFDPRPLT